jgi:hypothetical protein
VRHINIKVALWRLEGLNQPSQDGGQSLPDREPPCDPGAEWLFPPPAGVLPAYPLRADDLEGWPWKEWVMTLSMEDRAKFYGQIPLVMEQLPE